MITLVLVFKMTESENKTKYDNFYSNSKAEIIINKNGIDDVFQSIYYCWYEKEEKNIFSNVLIKNFNTFMYDHSLWSFITSYKKTFLPSLFTCFITEVILNSLIKSCFKLNSRKRIIMPKKDEYINFRPLQRKIKLPLIIYADFESIPVPKDNGKQNLNESYTNKNMLLVVMAITYGYGFG